LAVRPTEDPHSFSSAIGRDHLEKEFFDIRICAIILLDIVKYEDRTQMIQHFSRLLREGNISENEIAEVMERLPDLKKTGDSGGSARIGTLVNLKKVGPGAGPALRTVNTGRFLLPINAYLDLPDPFIAVEITISQIVEFAYCIRYACYVDDAYQHVSKNTFVNSRDMVAHRFQYKDGSYSDGSKVKGPEHEPLILSYEKEAAEFFRQYSSGIFLRGFSADDPRVPSLRVLSTPQIDFENLDPWFRARYAYRQYLRTRNFYCRYRDALLTYSDEGLYPNSSRPKGVTMIYSEAADTYDAEDNIGREIVGKADFFSESLIEYLFPYYWILYHSHIVEEQWSVELAQLRSLSTGSGSSEKSLEQRRQDLHTLLSFYGRFVPFANSEKVRIRNLLDKFNNWGRLHLAVTHQYKSNYHVDIFEDLITGVNNLSKAEFTAIADVQQEISTFLEYYKDLSNVDLTFSNMSLQTQIKWLTAVGAAAAAIALILGFLI
jgi:hypothetical protein